MKRLLGALLAALLLCMSLPGMGEDEISGGSLLLAEDGRYWLRRSTSGGWELREFTHPARLEGVPEAYEDICFCVGFYSSSCGARSFWGKNDGVWRLYVVKDGRPAPADSVEPGAEVRLASEGPGLYYVRRDALWTLCREDGTPFGDFAWTEAEMDAHDPPLVRFSNAELTRVRFGAGDAARYGYVDTSGELVLPAVYTRADAHFAGELTVVSDETGRSGIVDRAGEWVREFAPGSVPPRLTWDESDGSYLVESAEGRQLYSYANGRLYALTEVRAELDLTPYRAHSGKRTPRLDEPAVLRLDEPLPRVDGAKAVFPFYSGVVEAVYPAGVEYEEVTEANTRPVYTFTNTPDAYRRLISGDADVIFVAQPSEAQRAEAAAAGVEFELTPIMKEAFVFFVQADNPVDGLTLDQIRGIYSGAITDWAELGAPELGRIVAYQRNEGSGSQTALEKLMGDVPLMDPPSSVDIGDFMEFIVEVTEFRSFPNAIGFSFRFFVTGMMESSVKLLALDGVPPTEATIANGSYPVVAEVYAVTRKGEANPNVDALLDWLLSPQGQDLARLSGYVPVHGD